ncbi:MAG: amidohydrolase family protein [Pseudomonadota bacterium]
MVAFDCHAHVYDRIEAVGSVRYLPTSTAPLGAWLNLQRDHGLAGGVIVQVSFLGTDNSQLLGALDHLDRARFAGVAVTGLGASSVELRRLADGGVRGIRWNLVAGAPIPNPADPAVAGFLYRLRDHGMHLEVQLESGRLAAALAPLASVAGVVVVDHFGLPERAEPEEEPWLCALTKMPKRDGIFVKLSAPYRSTVDVVPHARRLSELLPPDQLLWGSDWPHTRFEDRASYAGLRDRIAGAVDDEATAHRLYGLVAAVGAEG